MIIADDADVKALRSRVERLEASVVALEGAVKTLLSLQLGKGTAARVMDSQFATAQGAAQT